MWRHSSRGTFNGRRRLARGRPPRLSALTVRVRQIVKLQEKLPNEKMRIAFSEEGAEDARWHTVQEFGHVSIAGDANVEAKQPVLVGGFDSQLIVAPIVEHDGNWAYDPSVMSTSMGPSWDGAEIQNDECASVGVLKDI